MIKGGLQVRVRDRVLAGSVTTTGERTAPGRDGTLDAIAGPCQ